jgi:hypothetical protein
MRITPEQKEAAQAVDAINFLETKYGLEFRHTGTYYILKSDKSVTFFPPEKNTSGVWRYKDFSAGHPSQGDLIAFLTDYLGVSFPDAVFQLSTFAGVRDRGEGREARQHTTSMTQRRDPAEKKNLVLPPKENKPSRTIAYLLKRRIDKEIIYDCLKKKTLYEDAEHHNCVFVGYDRIGIERYAALRGTYTIEGHEPFKGEASGSDKRYGFCMLAETPTEEVVVTESAIDAMFYATLEKMTNKKYQKHHILSLGCAADSALMQFIADHPEVKNVVLCLDNDKGGREATAAIAARLKKMGGITPLDKPMPSGHKDPNEYLKAVVEHKKKEERER